LRPDIQEIDLDEDLQSGCSTAAEGVETAEPYALDLWRNTRMQAGGDSMVAMSSAMQMNLKRVFNYYSVGRLICTASVDARRDIIERCSRSRSYNISAETYYGTDNINVVELTEICEPKAYIKLCMTLILMQPIRSFSVGEVATLQSQDTCISNFIG
jgi:hypothetical protein